jgi:hypothetical protein
MEDHGINRVSPSLPFSILDLPFSILHPSKNEARAPSR